MKGTFSLRIKYIVWTPLLCFWDKTECAKNCFLANVNDKYVNIVYSISVYYVEFRKGKIHYLKSMF